MDLQFVENLCQEKPEERKIEWRFYLPLNKTLGRINLTPKNFYTFQVEDEISQEAEELKRKLELNREGIESLINEDYQSNCDLKRSLRPHEEYLDIKTQLSVLQYIKKKPNEAAPKLQME